MVDGLRVREMCFISNLICLIFVYFLDHVPPNDVASLPFMPLPIFLAQDIFIILQIMVNAFDICCALIYCINHEILMLLKVNRPVTFCSKYSIIA